MSIWDKNSPDYCGCEGYCSECEDVVCKNNPVNTPKEEKASELDIWQERIDIAKGLIAQGIPVSFPSYPEPKRKKRNVK